MKEGIGTMFHLTERVRQRCWKTSPPLNPERITPRFATTQRPLETNDLQGPAGDRSRPVYPGQEGLRRDDFTPALPPGSRGTPHLSSERLGQAEEDWLDSMAEEDWPSLPPDFFAARNDEGEIKRPLLSTAAKTGCEGTARGQAAA
ncbi:MAG: hypothetical protein ACLQPN_11170 [Bryobacteraceae bacterium]